MNTVNDRIISQLTVRIDDINTENKIGSGVIYYNEELKDVIYIITAAHCLFKDGDNFQEPLDVVNVQFYNPVSNSYDSVSAIVNQKLLFKDIDKDIAILLFNKVDVETITGSVPKIFCVEQRQAFTDFIVKGFPNATKGEELDVIFPTWKQEMTTVLKFQLELKEDYSSWATEGFSGSGVFLEAHENIYLFGIFTRFRPEDHGRVIYCQYIDCVNELLENNYLPRINFSYLGTHGMTPIFFREKVELAIENLGPRFNEKLNFKLSLALKFDDLSKNLSFKSRVFSVFDSWLTEKSYRKMPKNEHLDEAEAKLTLLRTRVHDWLTNIGFKANDIFDIDWIADEIQVLNDFIDDKTDEVFRLSRQKEEATKDVKKDYSYRRPYSAELERLREIKDQNEVFLGRLESDVDVKLANHPFLVIKGEAGCGKSHLLGDIATEKLKKEVPVLLLLGQHFTSIKNIGANILEQLDQNCSFKEFLTALNNIGIQINSRVLILIDAINESKTADLWKDHLAGFVTEVSKYPFIGVAISIRTTYFKSVIPETLRKNSNISIFNHQGFRGNEYEALKLFCEFFKLKQPTFPILAPEFSNPLFLQLVCVGVSNSVDKSFPLGFHGIKEVFDLYISAISKKFLEKTEYANRTTLVRDAINKVAALCFSKDRRMLGLNEAHELFDKEFLRFPNLLHDLIQENVLIKNMHHDYENNTDYETVYFAYERFGDFYIAEELLKDYSTKEELLNAFEKNGPIGVLLEHYSNDGIFEAMAVLLPEKYSTEIFEVLDWVFQEEKELGHRLAHSEMISRYFLKSLTWRSVSSIDTDKLDIWLSSTNFLADDDEWISKLIELAAVSGHPLNSDRLHKGMKKLPMPKRDGFWQEYLLYYGNYNDYGSAYPIRRLIDWAWTKDISISVDFETARLTSQCLAWVLASTNIKLRDQTTKALVNLLEEQPEALLTLLKTFRNTNDLYILERLFAVAYGCVLRSSKLRTVEIIAKYTYNSIFKNGNPPKHILLRDYARNICEYALYLKVGMNFNMLLVRPPYKSVVPKFPSYSDIERFQIEFNKETENIPHRIAFNQIHYSLTSSDFGDKIVDSALHSFSPLRINGENEQKEFILSLDKNGKKIYKAVVQTIEIEYLYSKRREKAIASFGSEKKFEDHMKMLRDFIDKSIQFFTPEQQQWMIEIGIPHVKLKNEIKDGERYSFDTRGVKYWIVQRAFDLGYEKDLHGPYDSNISSYNDRHDNKVERIGKKYQWLAYYEILAVIADNYKLIERWGSRKPRFYKGAWALYLRNIDPAFTTWNDFDEEHKDNLGVILDQRKWWEDLRYSHWNIPDEQWASQIEDIPFAKDLVIKKDDSGEDWVQLQQFIEWTQPKSLGADRYLSPHKRMWFKIQAYIVRKSDKEKIFNYLSGKNFYGNWMPENQDSFSRLINREKFWSPAYFDEGADLKWDTIQNTNYKVIVATTSAKGNMESDKSGANATYNIPCQTLFEGLGLKYSAEDGNFMDSNGSIEVTNVNPNGVLMKKQSLLTYLAKHNLDMIWTVWGEKIADAGDHHYHIGIPGGVFRFNKDEFEGEITMHDRDD